jgi:hypothetical protein
MSYEGPFPLPVKSGGTGATTLTGMVTGNGTSALVGNTLTQYQTLTCGASNTITGISPGTTDQVLTSNGSSAYATYQTPLGVNWIFLASATASSSATVSLTSAISAAYNQYILLIYNLYPATDATNLQMNISTDNGGSWIAANYLSGNNNNPYNSATITNNNSTSTVILCNGITNNTANMSCCGYLTFQGLGAPQYFNAEGQLTYFASADSIRQTIVMATNTANQTVNALQFLMSSGNISTGTFTLYGIKES